MITPRNQILTELRGRPYNLENVPKLAKDANYRCPSVHWLEEFADWLRINRPFLGKIEANDCDNAALQAVVEANEAFRRGFPKDTNDCAVFWCDVSLTPSVPYLGLNPDFGSVLHRTNLVRCDDNRYYFFERQTCLIGEAENLIVEQMAIQTIHNIDL